MAVTASKFKQSQLNTLSLYFNEKQFSEKPYQDALIEKLQCNHHQFLLEEKDFNEKLPQILDSMDMPSCDGINTWFICQHAKDRGLKAVLSGLGGDELFGGYPSFNRMNRSLLLQQLPDMITSMGKRSKSKVLNRASYLRMDGIKGLYLFLRGHFNPTEIAYQLGGYEKDIWKTLDEQPGVTNISHLDVKNQASWMEFHLYMQNQLLRDSDVMSMHHGVEIRVPFLDDHNIRLAFRISPEIKYHGPRVKQFLVNAFNSELPQQIWDRPKMGFSFPFAEWLTKSSYVKEVMTDNTGELSKKNYTEFVKGNMHWSHLMSLLMVRKRSFVGV